ncbi:WecB/TagA/CpsF family glycosyltransferase [Desertivirga arenae]|uniref:WecB/TagA/CpsF family glycosyltransferase n=1 Tax=Desertivirga arenae TaxID=2810309 RepID=UPI001F616841|nr:WecB/TagA/CpsF family glycosyltransferase [Pedobacter sp. SYSU D00823]
MNYDTLTYGNTSVLEFPVYNMGLEQLDLNRKTLINTINQYSYIVTQKDTAFKKALMESDVLLPDGVGIVFASQLLNGQKIKKIAGADIHKYLLEQLNAKGGKCFYLGSTETTLGKIKEHLTEEYPNVKVETYSPPYKPEFDEEDNKRMIAAVNSFNPDVLFVGMTAPKQEKWAHAHKQQLNAKTICSIGAVFDFYAGTVNRPKQIWINLGLEWFIRLVNEPKRMWKRYLYYGPKFVYELINKKIQQFH